MLRGARGGGAAGEAPGRVGWVAHQHHLHELRPDLAAQLLQLEHEPEAPQVLRDHDVAPLAQLHPGHRQGQAPRDHPCRRRLVQPAAEHAPDGVDVQGEHQGVVLGVAAGQRGLPAARRAVDQDQAGHAQTLRAGAPPRSAYQLRLAPARA